MAMTLNTLPSLQTRTTVNYSSESETSSRHDNETEMVDDESDGENKYLSMIEAVCVCWMAVEYVARFWASPLR